MKERIENLQRIIKNILSSTDDQIQGDLRDSLRLRMSVSENLHGEVRYLKCLRALVEEKFQEFPKDYNDFVGIWSSLSEEAKSLCNDPKYDYDEEKYKYEFIYFEVYCNVYLRYSLGLLFNGNNKDTIDDLSQYNSLEIIQMYRYYLHQITLKKLEKSLKSDKVNS